MALLICASIILMPNAADAKSKKTQQKSSKTTSKQAAPYNPPYAHIVVNATTGRVLYQNDADRALFPASLTKVMTLLLTFEALDANKISLKSDVVFSTHATNMPPSRLGIKAGKSITVETAIKTLVTKSANDVAAAMGEKLGGSEGRFAHLMNLKARQIGMSQTHFENASGLHNVRQVSSARDMAKLAIYMMNTYPHYYKYFSLREFTYEGKKYKTHNHLMETYRGMDGLKTGYIYPSGFNLIASVKRGDTRLIGVVFGGKTPNARNAQMTTLLDSAFAGKPLITGDPQQTIPTSATPLKNLSAAPTQQAGILKKSDIAPKTYAVQSQNATNGTWAVQIGAFQDRFSTDQALYSALQRLPTPLNRGNAMVVPIRTSDATWVFRARIAGYTRDQAIEACKHLSDCLTVSPNAN